MVNCFHPSGAFLGTLPVEASSLSIVFRNSRNVSCKIEGGEGSWISKVANLLFDWFQDQLLCFPKHEASLLNVFFLRKFQCFVFHFVKCLFYLSQSRRACNSDQRLDQILHLLTTTRLKTTMDVCILRWPVGAVLMWKVNTPLLSSSRTVPLAHVRQISTLTLRGRDALLSHLVQDSQTLTHEQFLRSTDNSELHVISSGAKPSTVSVSSVTRKARHSRSSTPFFQGGVCDGMQFDGSLSHHIHKWQSVMHGFVLGTNAKQGVEGHHVHVQAGPS